MAKSKEHPIIFSSDMVKAILNGRKTQTRRICKDQTAKEYKWVEKCEQYPSTLGETYTGWAKDCGLSFLLPTKCPYGKVGDRLYVRERINNGLQACNFYYNADNKGVGNHIYKQLCDYGWTLKKVIPNIHMPKFAARIWLEITEIRVERVQEISEKDARAEGVVPENLIEDECDGLGYQRYKYSYKNLWDSINEKRGYSWESNCWVWVIEFRKYKGLG